MGVGKRKEPWEEFPELWPTKAKFFSWMRGCLRGGVWNKYPPKLLYKKSVCQASPPEWYTGRAKTGGVCALTGEWNVQSKMEIDHTHGNVSLNDWSDVLPFIQHLCATKDNMQVVSKEAHKVKSYAERMGMSFGEALLEKQVIALLKDKAATNKLLRENRMIARNAAERREKVREILQERDDCEHRYSPFELDGVPMWRCLRCGHVCEDETREKDEQQYSWQQ